MLRHKNWGQSGFKLAPEIIPLRPQFFTGYLFHTGFSPGTSRRSGANLSDFRKAGLKRQALNFGALNACMAIRRFVQLYECRSAFVL